MCGIAGIVDLSTNGRATRGEVAPMIARMAHRGPDADGLWNEDGVCFGHRRLSVLDLSAAGAQPMVSASGRIAITYNGEIYNFQDIRRDLTDEGISFRGNSDTEVLVEAIDRWGVEAVEGRLAGMFAVGVWERQEQRFHLLRDRAGIKPLYWSDVKGRILFASELTALTAHPDCPHQIDPDATIAYLRLGYVPASASILKGVYKLPPGHRLTVKRSQKPQVIPFWSPEELAAGTPRQNDLSDKAALDSFETLLRQVVRDHMVADVPLGVFLSGGIDSSLITAIMQAESSRPVRSFTIGFEDAAFNEAHHAKDVADHLKTDHTEVYLSMGDARDLVADMFQVVDEPLSDESLIPTLLLSRITREHVTVSLSGDGGDELFGGYNHHRLAPALFKKLSRIPSGLQSLGGSAALALYDGLGLGRLEALRRPVRLAECLPSASSDDLFRVRSGHIAAPERFVRGGTEYRGAFWKDLSGSVPEASERLMLLDMTSFMVDDVLTKVDRASMSASLEVRVPLLDNRIIDFSWSQPLNRKIRGNVNKWMLRESAYRHIPRALLDRPKKGFNIPLRSWLRGSLREWAETLLSCQSLEESGVFEPVPIRSVWSRLQKGTDRPLDYQLLWSILVFQDWNRRVLHNHSGRP